MADYTAVKIDEIEAIYGGAFKRARGALGASAFGLQVLDLPPNATGYPEHDHSEDGQEEVYVVLDGEAVFVINGEEVSAAEGDAVRVDPGCTRSVCPGPEGARILAIGCAPGVLYERPEDFRLAVSP